MPLPGLGNSNRAGGGPAKGPPVARGAPVALRLSLTSWPNLRAAGPWPSPWPHMPPPKPMGTLVAVTMRAPRCPDADHLTDCDVAEVGEGDLLVLVGGRRGHVDGDASVASRPCRVKVPVPTDSTVPAAAGGVPWPERCRPPKPEPMSTLVAVTTPDGRGARTLTISPAVTLAKLGEVTFRSL